MKKVMALSLGELVLKGKNRYKFVNKLISTIKRNLRNIDHGKIYQNMGKVYVELVADNEDKMINRLKHVFGIVYIAPCYVVETNWDKIEEGVITIVDEALKKNPNYKTFKVKTNRGDKSFPLNSMEISAKIGGIVLKNFDIKVDVHQPDFYVYCDLKKDTYIYIDKFKAYGGLPSGTNGRGLLLLSGGIDSPVAGFLMAKRGVLVDCLHFHSYPFTSERAEEKVKKLAEDISTFSGELTFYSVNILDIQKEININCPEDEMTIISRRFMMRIADKIAKEGRYDCIITGENLGQVASQTIDGLKVTNDITEKLVFRPLIGMDKVNIIDIAKDIDTYETSILPFEDCCTVFLPKHPLLTPTVEGIVKSEEKLDCDKLVDEALNKMKIEKIGGSNEE
ncbi:tRNA 4-thiouridine(8) synthase ThiI [Peptoniphilus sp. AGMB00490]|uniref:tRNA 4-thiouridine(8) synthase ThiI n=2 Tax=Peptoniphilus TaxID=162289 RepID=A0ACD6AYZ2_9FIRM|nr:MULTISPECIES: tRNA uracil 4-sulfurtransferase ThiI [Peptoniphilus]NMW86028.1 tRNA 4-thiouridine(8) synthase ThiI [Peptoniphilus faecalis]OLR64449.1 tRNA 4-thiouridine(8) synthase ThiI [Peptoniphilus porci]